MTSYCKNKNKKVKVKKNSSLGNFFSKFRLGKKGIMVSVCLFIVAFLMIYLVQVNNMATKGFEIRDLEDQITELQDSNKQLELQLVELQSMRNLAAKSEELGLVDAQQVSYLDIAGTTVAQR